MGHPKREAECSTSAQPAGSVDKRPDKEKRERNEAASNTAAKSAGSDDRRPVLPKGSVLQQSGSTVAGMATRSVAVQTEDPIRGALSLWDWLTPATVSSTATHTLDDGRSLHRFQEQYRVELQKVQHNTQYALNKRRDSGRRALTLRHALLLGACAESRAEGARRGGME